MSKLRKQELLRRKKPRDANDSKQGSWTEDRKEERLCWLHDSLWYKPWIDVARTPTARAGGSTRDFSCLNEVRVVSGSGVQWLVFSAVSGPTPRDALALFLLLVSWNSNQTSFWTDSLPQRHPSINAETSSLGSCPNEVGYYGTKQIWEIETHYLGETREISSRNLLKNTNLWWS